VAHIRKLGERRYQARWIDPDGRECSKIFSRRTDAEDKLKEVEHSMLEGSYIDHKNPITVTQYAKQWSATRPHRSTTATRWTNDGHRRNLITARRHRALSEACFLLVAGVGFEPT
jgi:hypothetical protein